MPYYQVKLKQGSTTRVEHCEAVSHAAALAFYEEFSTAKVSEILEVVYKSPSDTAPADDFNYTKLHKYLMFTGEGRSGRQLILHNIKKTKSTDDIIPAIKNTFRINGLPVQMVTASLIKQS